MKRIFIWSVIAVVLGGIAFTTSAVTEVKERYSRDVQPVLHSGVEEVMDRKEFKERQIWEAKQIYLEEQRAKEIERHEEVIEKIDTQLETLRKKELSL